MKQRRYLFLIFSLAFSFYFCGSSFADIVFLKNGRELEGQIIKEDELKIWLLTYGNAKIGIKKREILKIEPQEFIAKDSKARGDTTKSKGQAKGSKKSKYNVISTEVVYDDMARSDKKDIYTKDYSISGTTYQQVRFKDGKAIGKHVEYNKDGTVKLQVSMLGSKKEGKFVSYYKGGSIKYEGEYAGDLKSGLHKHYWPNARLKSKITYRLDKKHGLAQTFYESGELFEEAYYVDGKKSGEQKQYYKSGKVLAEMTYFNDEPQAKGKKYYENGKTQEEYFYDLGVTKAYFESGKIKSVINFKKLKYIEYDVEGNIIYNGELTDEMANKVKDQDDE